MSDIYVLWSQAERQAAAEAMRKYRSVLTTYTVACHHRPREHGATPTSDRICQHETHFSWVTSTRQSVTRLTSRHNITSHYHTTTCFKPEPHSLRIVVNSGRLKTRDRTSRDCTTPDHIRVYYSKGGHRKSMHKLTPGFTILWHLHEFVCLHSGQPLVVVHVLQSRPTEIGLYTMACWTTIMQPILASENVRPTVKQVTRR